MLVHRISDAENQIGGGLIEEVIQVAEGELKLVETMAESEVYVPPPSVEAVNFLRGWMLTSNADGTSLKRSRRKVNGTIFLGTSTLEARKSRRINRYPLDKQFRRHPKIPDLHDPVVLITFGSQT